MSGQPPIYVINMARDVARWQSMAAQIAELGLTCERVEAVDGRLLSAEQRKAVYSDFWFRLFHGRSASGGEIGCALSHRKIYALMIERGQEWVVILEDDALLSADFARDLAAYESETREFDVAQFYAFRLPDRFVHEASAGNFEVSRFSGPHGSTAAYGLRLSGAVKLLSQQKLKVAADKWAWLAAIAGVTCCGIVPYPVSLHETLSATSTISNGRKKTLLWRMLVLPILRVVLRSVLVIRGL
jgi:glycosyl transferase, family 25